MRAPADSDKMPTDGVEPGVSPSLQASRSYGAETDAGQRSNEVDSVTSKLAWDGKI